VKNIVFLGKYKFRRAGLTVRQQVIILVIFILTGLHLFARILSLINPIYYLIDENFPATQEYLGFMLVNLLDFIVSIGFMHLFNQISKKTPPSKVDSPSTPDLLLKIQQTDASESIE